MLAPYYTPAGRPCPRCEGGQIVRHLGEGLRCLACGYEPSEPVPTFIIREAKRRRTREPGHGKLRL
jgi:hypothetical protein